MMVVGVFLVCDYREMRSRNFLDRAEAFDIEKSSQASVFISGKFPCTISRFSHRALLINESWYVLVISIIHWISSNAFLHTKVEGNAKKVF